MNEGEDRPAEEPPSAADARRHARRKKRKAARPGSRARARSPSIRPRQRAMPPARWSCSGRSSPIASLMLATKDGASDRRCGRPRADRCKGPPRIGRRQRRTAQSALPPARASGSRATWQSGDARSAGSLTQRFTITPAGSGVKQGRSHKESSVSRRVVTWRARAPQSAPMPIDLFTEDRGLLTPVPVRIVVAFCRLSVVTRQGAAVKSG